MEHLQTLIIGAGPAGYTAAIYAARANLKPVMYVGNQPGGQLTITNDVENYPGFPDGVGGPEMMEMFAKQAKRFETDVRYGVVTEVDFSGHPHVVTIDGEKTLTADAVIIATGASAKWLGLPSESRLNGSGVSACAVCDGFFYRKQTVAIVGAGDTACEEALYLSKICLHVHMLVRKSTMRASKIMEERVKNTANITIHWNTETEEILGENVVEAIKVREVSTGKIDIIPVQGFFVAIGHQPNSAVFSKYLEMDPKDTLLPNLILPKLMWRVYLLVAMYRIKISDKQ